MNDLMDKMQRLVSYYNLHKHELTEENKTYLIGQLHSLSEACLVQVRQSDLCLRKKVLQSQSLKKSIVLG